MTPDGLIRQRIVVKHRNFERQYRALQDALRRAARYTHGSANTHTEIERDGKKKLLSIDLRTSWYGVYMGGRITVDRHGYSSETFVKVTP